jgi:hypothetical protein
LTAYPLTSIRNLLGLKECPNFLFIGLLKFLRRTMTTLETRTNGANPDGRSGGNGGGDLPAVKYKAPDGFVPRIIKSSADGIEVSPAPSIETPAPLPEKSSKPTVVWISPETGLH